METITAALCAGVCPNGIRRDTRAISVRSCASAAVWAIPVHLFLPVGRRCVPGRAGVFGCASERVARGGSEKRRGDAFPLPETADGKLSLLAEEPIRRRAAGCDAVLLGCGLGRDWQTDSLVQDLLNMEKPLVLDADGLNAISENAELLQKRPAVTVLTPHEGEFLRLGGDLSRGREAAAAVFSQKYGVYLILKGHRTLIADPEGRLAVNNTGNCGMAKGGQRRCAGRDAAVSAGPGLRDL